MRTLPFLAAALLLASCAAFDMRGLQPGQATESQVIAQLGQPALRLPQPGGGSALYYPQAPEGRQTYVAVLGPDGVLRSFEQRLVPQEFAKITKGTTADQVRGVLGPPWQVTHFRFKNQDVWEYKWLAVEEKRVLWLGFTPDGKVAEITNIHDFESDPPSGPDFP